MSTHSLRRIEWASAIVMLMWAAMLAMPGATLISVPPYRPLLWTGWTEDQLAVILGITGLIWCAGLWINGRLMPTPLFRALAAAIGAAFWTGIAMLHALHAWQTGIWDPGAAPYIVLAVGDITSSYFCGRDLITMNRLPLDRAIRRLHRTATDGDRG